MLTKSGYELLSEHPEDQVIAGGLAFGATIPFDRLSKRIGESALSEMPQAGIFLPIKLRDKLGRGVTIVRSGVNAYDPLHDTIHHDGSMAVAHEFGHAQSPYRKYLGRVGQAGLNLTNFFNKKYRALPISMAVYSASPDDDNYISGTAVGALSAAQAAQLYEEGGASLRGLKLLKDEVSPQEYAKAKKAFIKAFGSYAIPAVGATAAAAAIGNILKSYRMNKNNNENR